MGYLYLFAVGSLQCFHVDFLVEFKEKERAVVNEVGGTTTGDGDGKGTEEGTEKKRHPPHVSSG